MAHDDKPKCSWPQQKSKDSGDIEYKALFKTVLAFEQQLELHNPEVLGKAIVSFSFINITLPTYDKKKTAILFCFLYVCNIVILCFFVIVETNI